MQFNTISSVDYFNMISGEWNELLTCCSASHVPFLRHEYISTWWKTLGGGEWDQGELHIVTARGEDGSLIGIAPLFYSQNREDVPALLLLGSVEISDYLDLIVREDVLPEFTTELLRYLSNENNPSWQVLDLFNIPEDSPTIPALKNATEKLGWEIQQEKLQHCPYIPLPGDWEEYLAGIDKKQRHEIRRKMRRANEFAVSTRWYIVEDEYELEHEITDFLALMAQDPDKDRFLTDVMRTQMRDSVFAAYKAGWLQLAFLTVGDEKAAGYLNFDYADHIWVYNSGLNFKFRELSPGWVLLAYLLQWANENGKKFFDFMRGDESYKYRFGAVDRFIHRVVVSKN